MIDFIKNYWWKFAIALALFFAWRNRERIKSMIPNLQKQEEKVAENLNG